MEFAILILMSETERTIEAQQIAPLPEKLISRLCGWYERKRRNLPWRADADPYHVWVSEIMLQQTRVETVIPYYERFLKRLPDVQALSQCPEEELLKLWEGLGYYSRVRNMRDAAQRIVSPEGFHGVFPSTVEELLTLPGLGAYTAGAIASIAFGERVPAVDGNALRILTRLRADTRPVDQEKTKKAISAELSELMQEETENYSPGDFNQAFMDLGSAVCLSHAQPACGACPLGGSCLAHAKGREADFPVKGGKKARAVCDLTILRIRDGERILIEKRPAKGLLAGLWEFPNRPGHLSEKEALADVEALGLLPLHIERLPAAKHIFSHVEWHMIGYEIRVAAFEGRVAADRKAELITPEELQEKYSMPSAFAAYRLPDEKKYVSDRSAI